MGPRVVLISCYNQLYKLLARISFREWADQLVRERVSVEKDSLCEFSFLLLVESIVILSSSNKALALLFLIVDVGTYGTEPR